MSTDFKQSIGEFDENFKNLFFEFIQPCSEEYMQEYIEVFAGGVSRYSVGKIRHIVVVCPSDYTISLNLTEAASLTSENFNVIVTEAKKKLLHLDTKGKLSTEFGRLGYQWFFDNGTQMK